MHRTRARGTIGPVEDGHVVDAFARDHTVALPGGASLDDGTWAEVAPDDSTPEILAAPGSAAASLWSIAAERELRPFYPAKALDETRRWQADPGIDDPSLDDLTHLPFVTIDEPHSKDLDQAVHVEARADGTNGFTVWYAIADAAHFAHPAGPGSALFAEALERGSTFYLPGLVFPMLPPELSEDLISINPAVDRRALVFQVDLDADGEVVRTRLRRGRVRSRWKTSYQEVQAFYDDGQGVIEEAIGRGAIHVSDAHSGGDAQIAETLARGLEALRDVGRARMRRASERDVVQVQRREISVATEGLRFVAMADPRHDSERYNEQISLLCNVVGAHFLAEGSETAAAHEIVQGIFRFHQPPDDFKLHRLRREIDAMVRHHRLDQDRWSWRRGDESLADYVERLPTDAPDQVASVARAIRRQALLAGGRAGFGPVPGVHHGVGADAYARFTAPMREVVGVFVHKETWEKLGLAKPSPAADDERLRDEIVSAADRSRQLQRRLDDDTNRLVLDQLFGDDLARAEPPRRTGTVLGVSKSKLYVQLDDPPIDVKIYLRYLAQQLGTHVEAGYDRVSVRAGRRHFLAVGDRVHLRVLGTERSDDRWRLEVERDR